MANNFSTYLESQKLAKMMLTEAELAVKQFKDRLAIGYLIKSVRAFQTSTNCMVALYFNKKGKKKKAVCHHIVRTVRDGAVYCKKCHRKVGEVPK